MNSLSFWWIETMKPQGLVSNPMPSLIFSDSRALSFSLSLHVKHKLAWKTICRFIFSRGFFEFLQPSNLFSFEYVSHFALTWSFHACVLICFSHVWLFVTPWTMARQAPLSMGFSRKEYWNRLPCLPPEDLPDPGTEPVSPAKQVDSLPLSHQGSPTWSLP